MHTYSGIALHPSLPRGRKSGEIKLEGKRILFISEGTTLTNFTLEECEITQGGTGNRYVYFNPTTKSEWTIYTDEKKILKEPVIAGNPDLKKSASKIQWNRRLLYGSVGTIAALFLAVIVLFYIFKGNIVHSIAESIPVEWEQEMSATMLESATAGKSIVEDKVLLKQLAQITDPLVNALNDKSYKFSFTIVDDPTLNAFALPGGAIVIHSGLILEADHVNEVAGVLAHEISHVTQRHHVRGIIDKLGFFTILSAFFGDMTFGTQLAAAGASLESLKYSRDYEREADDYGWNLMLEANLNPEGMISFFKKLKHEHGDLAEAASFMSTHPGTTERIETLKSKELTKHSFDEIDIDFESFQKDIDNYFNNN